MSDLKYWIALSMLPDVGPIRARNLLEVFSTPEQIFNAREKELCFSGRDRSEPGKEYSCI